MATMISMCKFLVVLSVAQVIYGKRFLLPQDEEANIDRRQLASACDIFNTNGPVYRTADGGCNNLVNSDWGKAGIPLRRHIANTYDDGSNVARLNAKSGNPLPSARKVSTTVHVFDPATPPDNRWTVMFMQWGQFLDHDITATPLTEGSTASCCTAEVNAGAEHPDVATGGPCLPIHIPADDTYFGPKGVTCLDFKRSLDVSQVGSNREQENVITAFVDGSQVYGSSPEEQEALRSGVNGQLKVANGEHLPQDTDAGCFKVLDTDYCFLAGDHRVNVFPGLAALHTAFMRLHNQIATRIAAAHDDWTDEQIFQETRKIVIAILQHITYAEYLPEVLGLEGVNTYNLNAVDYNYDPNLDPSLFNTFPTAAFRFGHSTISAKLTINNTDIATEDLFLRPYYVLHHLRSLVESLIRHPSERNDRFFVEAITNKLFLSELGSTDLIASNINRGRDHGLPTYNDAREHICGLPRITSFDSRVFRNFGNIIGQVYESVDDIDLFTGGVLERNINGGTLGETFSCIIGTQFKNLKFGDSFWYETKDSQRGFTTDKLAEIKKISLARVLCDTVADLRNIQPFVMIPSRITGNERRSCSDIANFDLNVLMDVTPSSQPAEAAPQQSPQRLQRPFRLNNGGSK